MFSIVVVLILVHWSEFWVGCEMHINLERNSQMLDVDKLKWFLPCLLFSHLLLDWKDNKGKENSLWACWNIHLLVDRCFGSTLKMLAKEVTYFDVFYVRYIETSGSKLEKKCCLIRNLPIALNEMQWKSFSSVYDLIACKFSHQADKHQHHDLGVGAGLGKGSTLWRFRQECPLWPKDP